VAATSKLTIAAHVLAWMALVKRQGLESVTSDQIAVSVNTNPVVIRRTLAELRGAGLVTGRRGAGAGWQLARAPESISLADVWESTGGGQPFSLHHSPPSQDCPVGRGIQPALSRTYAGVDAAIRAELARTSIADLLVDVLAAAWTSATAPAETSP
jgi:DNA-binding IscR family transcriptional regulator